jgi:hypothetical protein
MSRIIELKPSLEMHPYHKDHTIQDIGRDILKTMAGYHTSYSSNEYLKDLGLMTEKRTITKLGKEVAMRIFSYPDQVVLIKPED